MAKRKNPLKDLDAFLKQEAKNFVEPEKVVHEIESEEDTSEKSEQPLAINKGTIQEYLAKLNEKNPGELYQLILDSLANTDNDTAKQKMLINTLLYLQDQENWKHNVKAYWS